jgi:hypothetical protein
MIGPADAVTVLLAIARRTQGREALAAARYADAIERAPEGRRRAIVAALSLEQYPHLRSTAEYDDALRLARNALPSELQHVNDMHVAQLVLGVSPQELSGGLTRREARRWLAETRGSQHPTRWLLMEHGAPRAMHVRSMPVARWVISVLRDAPRREALERWRTVRNPAGHVLDCRLVDRVDELTPDDLRDCVERTFVKAANRAYAETVRVLEKKVHAPLRAAPAWWQPHPHARLLLTGDELLAEGRDMEHCVATYAAGVRDGTRLVVAIDASSEFVPGLRSTAELDPSTLEVRQHRGRRNASPNPLCESLLRFLLPRWRARARIPTLMRGSTLRDL